MNLNRDNSVDILKGIGILFVVSGHCGYDLIPGIVAYSFHVQLFYFVAGFFLNFQDRWFVFLKKRIRTLLLPYFAYNLFFGVVTYLLSLAGISWAGGGDGLASCLSAKNILLEPFISGWQYPISGALWFVPSLFIVNILLLLTRQIILFSTKRPIYVFCFVTILIATYYFCINTATLQENEYVATVSRSVVGYCFSVLGYFYWRYLKNANSSVTFVLASCMYLYMRTTYDFFPLYSVHHNNYGQPFAKLLSLPYALAGTIMCISVAKMINVSSAMSVVKTMAYFGKKSFHIMAIHMSFIFMFNVILAIALPYAHLHDINGIFFQFPRIPWAYFLFVILSSCYTLMIYDKICLMMAGISFAFIMRKIRDNCELKIAWIVLKGLGK